MVPTNELFVFHGTERKVVLNHDQLPVVLEKDKIFLGNFLHMKTIQWCDDKMVHDGLAVFEHGSICFPDYKLIQIYKKPKKNALLHEYESAAQTMSFCNIYD